MCEDAQLWNDILWAFGGVCKHKCFLYRSTSW
jgi:hypothetical protein